MSGGRVSAFFAKIIDRPSTPVKQSATLAGLGLALIVTSTVTNATTRAGRWNVVGIHVRELT